MVDGGCWMLDGGSGCLVFREAASS